MKVTKPAPEVKETVAKEVKEVVPAANPQNMNPVTSSDSVNIKQTPKSIADSETSYGSINRSSVIESLTRQIKATMDIPGSVEFTKSDVEKIAEIFKNTINDAVKTAHVAIFENGLSSVSVWSPLGMAFRVAPKSNTTGRNPALLLPATRLKKELLGAGNTLEDVLENADYQALVASWEASEKTTDNKGCSTVKIKEALVSASGITAIDAAVARAPIAKA